MNGQTRLPHDIGAIHFTGIGGIGMSGIAEVLLNHGFTVQRFGDGLKNRGFAGTTWPGQRHHSDVRNLDIQFSVMLDVLKP
jgi:hypothetical protein